MNLATVESVDYVLCKLKWFWWIKCLNRLSLVVVLLKQVERTINKMICTFELLSQINTIVDYNLDKWQIKTDILDVLLCKSRLICFIFSVFNFLTFDLTAIYNEVSNGLELRLWSMSNFFIFLMNNKERIVFEFNTCFIQKKFFYLNNVLKLIKLL